MNQPIDRLDALLHQNYVAGIDFISVGKSQKELFIHLYHSETLKPGDLLDTLTPAEIVIRSMSGTRFPIIPVLETKRMNDHILRVRVGYPGDFTLYRLTIDHPRIDFYYNNVVFSFKVNCETGLDCKTKTAECPPEPEVDFPVDYMARDFWSFRRALLEFASVRYPGWKDRLEADAGIMLVEMMSAMGDEMAYYQDRIGREAYLETATQRRSVRRHARFMDYDLDDGEGSSSWLDFSVTGEKNDIRSGTCFYTMGEEGERIFFEAGNGLQETIEAQMYPVRAELNAMSPYMPDETSTCLHRGSTAMCVDGHHADALNAGNKWVLLRTDPDDASVNARRQMVRLIKAENKVDLLNGNHPYTCIEWDKVHAINFGFSMKFNMTIHGNLVPVTAGKTLKRSFIIGENHDDYDRAVEREGRDGTVSYLYSLPGSEDTPLAWIRNAEGDLMPQVELYECDKTTLEINTNLPWQCRRSLLGAKSSDPDDPHFMLEDGTWKRVTGYQRNGQEVVHTDYASGSGTTIRFGDGEFGRIPPEGTVFRVIYRLGGGSKTNVPANSIIHINREQDDIPWPDFIQTVRNSFPLINGRDPESLDEAKKIAPYRFRSITERAVLADDYAKAAERLDWVQKAGASFRWTGSWLSAFVTPDPQGTTELTEKNRLALYDHLDRFRQAGREVIVTDPVYADIDLEITVCVAQGSYRGEVKEKVLRMLFGSGENYGKKGCFSPDRFTFGTALDRSKLESAIQSVPGVNAVMGIRIRRRGCFPMMKFKGSRYDPGKDAIIRIGNDPLYPERGSVKLFMEGGA